MSPDSSGQAFRGRVRYVECDAHGELFIASCVNYLSEAAAHALRSVDIDLRAITAEGGAFREYTITARFRHPLGYDDQFEVVTWLGEQQPQGFTLAFDVSLPLERRLMAQGVVQYVARPSPFGRAAALPPNFWERLSLLQYRAPGCSGSDRVSLARNGGNP